MDESDFSEENGDEQEPEEEQLDPNNPEHAFPIIERDFNKTLGEIEHDPNAAHFAEQFSRLFETLYQTHQDRKALEHAHETLQEEFEKKSAKLELATRQIDTDTNTIRDLKLQLEHSWKLADAAHSREQTTQEIIDNLRIQILALNAEIDFKNKMSQDTTEEMGVANKRKEGLQREKDKLMGEVAQLTQKLNNALEYQTELEAKNSSADLKIGEISMQLEEQLTEVDRFKRIRDKLESDITDLSYKVEDRDLMVDNLNNVINTHLKTITKLETHIKDDKAIKEKLSKELEALNLKCVKLQEDYLVNRRNLGNLQKELNEKLTALKLSQDENVRMKNDIVKITRTKDWLEKRNTLAEGEKNDLLQERNNLRQRLANFEREIEDLKKQVDAEKRTAEQTSREKEILSKTIMKHEAMSKDQHKLIRIQEQGKKKLETELDSAILENNKFTKTVSGLERDKDRLTEEQLFLNRKIEEGMDEIKLKKAEIYELKKSLTESENKLRMQQNLFDSIRSERNSFEKALQEINAETGELKKKLKISTHQIEQLKEDASVKEQLLIKEENMFKKVLKEKENLNIELNRASENIKILKQEISEKDDEEKRLHKSILENEKTIRDQAKDLEQLMNERDILGSQVVRRNDEIALLHEKISILQTTLQRGESQYEQRLEDIKLLKIEIKRLRQDNNLLSKNVSNSVDLRQEVFHLERDLTKIRLKCRALEEEMQNPMNIHRWRKLEGSDPEAFDLLQKIQLLQKRLLKQSAEAVERERQLKEVERLYLNLKQVLAKQPGPGIQAELNKTQRALKNRGDQLKCLVSELNMAELRVKEYKSDLQRVTDELAALKKKYLADKKAQKYQKLALDSSRASNQNRNTSALQQQSGSQVKFTGGGFRMSVQSITSNN